MRSNLVRKQYLISEKNIKKIEKIANKKGTSAANIVRKAIDAYDPQNQDNTDQSDLMKLVALKLKEAIKTTKKANHNIDNTLQLLNKAKQ